MKLLILVLLFLISRTSFSMEFEEEDSLISNIENAFYADSIDEANQYLSILQEKYPANFKNIHIKDIIAGIAFKQNDMESALKQYNEILKMKFKDSLNKNYKYEACVSIAKIYLLKKDYKNALKYTEFSDKKYPFINHWCGYQNLTYSFDKELLYSQCYIGMENYKKVLEILAPFIFSNYLTYNTKLFDNLCFTFLKLYSETDIKKQFAQSLNKIHFPSKKKDGKTYLLRKTKLFKRDIFIPISEQEIRTDIIEKMTIDEQKKICIDIIKRTKIYMWSQNL